MSRNETFCVYSLITHNWNVPFDPLVRLLRPLRPLKILYDPKDPEDLKTPKTQMTQKTVRTQKTPKTQSTQKTSKTPKSQRTIYPLGSYSVQSVGAAEAVSWAIAHNPGRVATPLQDTRMAQSSQQAGTHFAYLRRMTG